jgi:hypothetical protein
MIFCLETGIGKKVRRLPFLLSLELAPQTRLRFLCLRLSSLCIAGRDSAIIRWVEGGDGANSIDSKNSVVFFILILWFQHLLGDVVAARPLLKK